eukprot:694121-Amphidinium_carterae.1
MWNMDHSIADFALLNTTCHKYRLPPLHGSVSRLVTTIMDHRDKYCTSFCSMLNDLASYYRTDQMTT